MARRKLGLVACSTLGYVLLVAGGVGVARFYGNEDWWEFSRAVVPGAIAIPGSAFAYLFPLRLSYIRRFEDAREAALHALPRLNRRLAAGGTFAEVREDAEAAQLAISPLIDFIHHRDEVESPLADAFAKLTEDGLCPGNPSYRFQPTSPATITSEHKRLMQEATSAVRRFRCP